MGGVCGSPKDSSVEEPPEAVIKIIVLVVKVQGLPADKVPLEDRSLILSCQTGMEEPIEKCMMNVIDPAFNQEFETQAGILEFKVIEELAGEATCLGQATLDATNLDTFAGDLQLEGGPTSGAVITLKVKAEGFGYPVDANMTDYSVTIDNPKKTKSLGLELDSIDGIGCYVSSVKASSLVDKHNKSAEESNQLPAGSYIVSYNGVSDKIEAAMKKAAPTLEFTVRPMEKFRIGIDRSLGETLGIDVPAKPFGNSVLVNSVKEEGFVAKWNSENPEQEVKKGDRIIEVNGKPGKSKQLIDMIKKSPKTERVVLTLIRMAPQPE